MRFLMFPSFFFFLFVLSFAFFHLSFFFQHCDCFLSLFPCYLFDCNSLLLSFVLPSSLPRSLFFSSLSLFCFTSFIYLPQSILFHDYISPLYHFIPLSVFTTLTFFLSYFYHPSPYPLSTRFCFYIRQSFFLSLFLIFIARSLLFRSLSTRFLLLYSQFSPIFLLSVSLIFSFLSHSLSLPILPIRFSFSCQ